MTIKLLLELFGLTLKSEYDILMYQKDKYSNASTVASQKITELLIQQEKDNQMIEDLNSEIIDLRLEKSQVDLTQFETTKTRLINGSYMRLSKWLNNSDNITQAGIWAAINLQFIDNSKDTDTQFVYNLRNKIYSYFKKDLHIPEKANQDIWQNIKEFIDGGFKGDCDDWMTFIYAVIYAVAETNNRLKVKDNLFGVLCGINYKDGFNWGNHASLLWRTEEGKFYIVETAADNGSDYIQDALNKFNLIEYKDNLRYGRIVFMSTYSKDYYQPKLW